VVAFRYVEVGVNAVEQALEIGAIARSLYLALSRTDCLCVENEDFIGEDDVGLYVHGVTD